MPLEQRTVLISRCKSAQGIRILVQHFLNRLAARHAHLIGNRVDFMVFIPGEFTGWNVILGHNLAFCYNHGEGIAFMHTLNEEVNSIKKIRWMQPWPIAAYLAASMLLAFTILWIQNNQFFSWQWHILNGLISGFALGQASWLAVVGGLWGRCWLTGIWVASLLAALLTLIFMLDESFNSIASWSDFFVSASGLWMLPLIILGISLPMLALRFVWGWQWVNAANEKKRLRTPLGLEEMMLGVTTVAALLFLTRVPQTIWEQPTHIFFQQIGVAFALLATVSLLSALPLLLCSVRVRSPWRRHAIVWLGACLLTTAVFATFEAIMQYESWSIFQNGITACVAGLMAGSLFVFGLAALTWSGLRVQGFTAREILTPEMDEQLHREIVKQRREHRYWVGTTLAVSMLSSFTLVGLTYARHQQDERLNNLARELASYGGSIIAHQRRLIALSLGQTATDDNLAKYAQHSYLSELSLANSQVTDAGLAQLPELFPNLVWLDLSGTKITSAGLQHLLKLPSLISLSLAGTKLEMTEIHHFLKKRAPILNQANGTMDHRLIRLDLSNMSISQEDLVQLAPTCQRLILRNNGLTDATLAALQGRYFVELDISGNPISGVGLSSLKIESLIAKDVPLTDAAFAKALVSLSLNKLEISHTQLTDAILPTLGTINLLSLGEGQFTEAGVEKSVLMNCNRLGLNGPQFTGRCFSQLATGGYVQSLDLRGSGITDSNLRWLKDTTVNRLDLSETKVTDRGLQALDGASIYALNLSGTQVTARGVANCRLSDCTIYLKFGQFTVQEIQQLQQQQTILVGDRFPDPL